ncbi:STAS domain-containing protein [Vibrio sp. S4M6]|uniref:STAS domain-containing protein n=1 Tax=Vibrio sinus TaxID=2946865 RepID=UPI002029D597|nr:STAS domain-containing protein [Vibrio sinus]MCL9781673.1 STAS domain-containing protein [Vibrio sinus]
MDCLLDECLDISTVMDATSTYQQWLNQSAPLKIDASKVMRVDTAGIQALASMFTSAKATEIEIQLINSTDTLLEGISILGLAELFETH